MTIAPNRVMPLASSTRPSQPRWPTRVSAADYSQGSLALVYPLPSGLPAEPAGRTLSLVEFGPEPPTAAVEAWAAKFLQAVVEVVSSDRPVNQLARWTSRAVYSDLVARRNRVSSQQAARGVRPARHQVATVRACMPSDVVAEVAGRVATGRRSRALAARLEYVETRWLCTELVFG